MYLAAKGVGAKESNFFFNDTATTEIYTLSLHDALPICTTIATPMSAPGWAPAGPQAALGRTRPDRKSTRLNSCHSQISYAVFCLKKKKLTDQHNSTILLKCL